MLSIETVWGVMIVVVLERLRCQLLLLTFATGEHHADCSGTQHGDGSGFGGWIGIRHIRKSIIRTKT